MSRATSARPRAIVFDLDDTLYAQRDFKLSGFRAVAQWLGEHHAVEPATAFAAMQQALEHLGPSHPHLLDEALARLGLGGVDVAQSVGVFRRHAPAIAAYPGVRAMLTRLRTHYRLGLLTDGFAQVQRGKVAALGLEPLFDALLFSDELGTAKPDAALFAWFEQRFGVDGKCLVYVGDNPRKDFVGARSRGWRTVRVRNGEFAGDEPPGPSHAADHEIARIGEVSRLLAALCADTTPEPGAAAE